MTIQPARAEETIQIIILIAIGGMAGAASFTHVHDWTMHHSLPGTGNWFGWANAVISELTPTAAGLDIRRRKRHHAPVIYPMAVLIAAALLSLTAQVAEATPGITGWLVAAVPALAFLALSKLILSRPASHRQDTPSPPPATGSSPVAPAVPIPTREPDPEPGAELGTEPPAHLLTSARMAAFAHQQTTGQPITTDGLADHLAISPTLARTLLAHLDGSITSPVTTANGTPIGGRP